MKILVATICYNRAALLPFWLRHYSSFADEIWVADDKSTDGSREILRANPKVQMETWPFDTGIEEMEFLRHAYREMERAARNKFDWMIWADTDEFVYHPDIRLLLEKAKDWDVLRCAGFNMTGEGLPKDDGKSQLWELLTTGVRAPVYSKAVVFRPQVKVRWDRGKHHLEPDSQGRVSDHCLLKLLHYRYLGSTYTGAGNMLNYQRFSIGGPSKGGAWSCAPTYRGIDKEGSPEWAAFAHTVSFNAVEAPLYD